MARPRKPTVEKLIHGERNLDRINRREPIPKGVIGAPPDHLDDDQKEIWEFAVKHSPRGVLKPVDSAIFYAWVVAVSIHRRATIRLNEEGEYAQRKDYAIPNPLMGVIARQAETINKLGGQLGFDPVSRSRIQAGDKDMTDAEMLERFLS